MLKSTPFVDDILIEGDRMYLNALENGEKPDAKTISLNHLPDQNCWPLHHPSTLQNQCPLWTTAVRFIVIVLFLLFVLYFIFLIICFTYMLSHYNHY